MPSRAPQVRSGGRIVVADDLAANLSLLERLLAADGHTVFTAADGDAALSLIETHRPDLAVIDVMMPKRDGLDVCRAIKANPDTRLIPIVLVTALTETEQKIRGLEAGADDFLTKPVNAPELRARVNSLLRIKRFTDDLESAESVILSLAMTIEARDAGTDGHCQRLAAYGMALGRALGLSAEEIAALERGAYLHDVGKVGVPDAVLLKPGRLTPAEMQVMQQHTIIGDRLCGSLRSLRAVRPIVRHHHERLDGTGYPDGLRGDDIPLLARIISVVDIFDALTSVRPYRQPMTVAEASLALADEAARGWRDPVLVETFARLVRDNTSAEIRHAIRSAGLVA